MIFANFPAFPSAEAAAQWRAAFASIDEVNAWMRAAQDPAHAEWLRYWATRGEPAPERPVAPIGSFAPVYVVRVVDVGGGCLVATTDGAQSFVPFPRTSITQGLAQLAGQVREQHETAQAREQLRQRLMGQS